MLSKIQKCNVIVFIYFIVYIVMCTGEKIRYISTEHPHVTFIDNVKVTYANLTAERYGRSNPMYYVGLHATVTVWLDNNLVIDFYFYEFLSNVYKRGFVEMHFKWCDFMNDKFFGAALRQGKMKGPCPYPPYDYDFYNMTVDVKQIPRSFPFTKGRIYANFTHKKTLMASGYVDMEVKEFNVRRQKSKLKLTSLN